MSTHIRRIVLPILGAALLASLVACAAPQPADAGAEAGIALTSSEPLKGDAATLYVNGLSCPLCASNIDKQLTKLPGVQKVGVDLSSGKVDLSLGGDQRPTPNELSTAVADSGFTLVRIVTN